MSFKIKLDPVDKVSSRFLGQVHALLANAALEAKKKKRLTQRKVAEELGMDKGQLSKILTGAGNPTVRTIGMLCAVMGYRPELVLHEVVETNAGQNISKVEVSAMQPDPAQFSTPVISLAATNSSKPWPISLPNNVKQLQIEAV